MYLEQILTAHKVEQMGAGLSAPTLKPPEMEEKLSLMLASGTYAEKAKAFSSHDREREPSLQQQRLVQFVVGMINGRGDRDSVIFLV